MRNIAILFVSVTLSACASKTEVKETDYSTGIDTVSATSQSPKVEDEESTERGINAKKGSLKDLAKIANTQWTCSPMKEHPECIDSLIFKDSTGFSYSCEHEMSLEFNYELVSDTLRLDIYDYASHTSDEVILSERQYYTMEKHHLKMVRFSVNRGDHWDDINLGSIKYDQVLLK